MRIINTLRIAFKRIWNPKYNGNKKINIWPDILKEYKLLDHTDKQQDLGARTFLAKKYGTFGSDIIFQDIFLHCSLQKQSMEKKLKERFVDYYTDIDYLSEDVQKRFVAKQKTIQMIENIIFVAEN